MEPESGAGEALDLPDDVRESNVPDMERKVGMDESAVDGEWWYRGFGVKIDYFGYLFSFATPGLQDLCEQS